MRIFSDSEMPGVMIAFVDDVVSSQYFGVGATLAVARNGQMQDLPLHIEKIPLNSF